MKTILLTAENLEIAAPDISEIVIEDDTPVDNLLSEKQQRLLVLSLYSSLSVEIPFLATANVGLFYALKQPPLVPDVMLSFGVTIPEDWSQKQNRSYFVWNFGKPPEVVIEIVSNKVGEELSRKLIDYANAGVSYYVVFDPLQLLGETLLQVYERRGTRYHLLADTRLEGLDLSLTLWQGSFEDKEFERWLRWCDLSGNILLTGDEKAEIERQRAEIERQRAETERQRAKTERQRAETERQRADRLADFLRSQGINPDDI